VLTAFLQQGQQSYGTVTTEVQITAESSGSQTPPSTPAGSIAPVLHKPAPVAALDLWGSPSDDDDDRPVSPTTISVHHNNHSHHQHRPTHTNQFTTTATISSTRRPPEPKPKRQSFVRTWRKFRAKLANLDPIKLAYLRTSFVFAISILVTWTPSSINRVYSLIYPTRTSYGLNLAGAVVLPLQGLWNAIIFAATSWGILKEEFRERGWRVRGWFWGLSGRDERGGEGDCGFGDHLGAGRRRRLSDGLGSGHGGKRPVSGVYHGGGGGFRSRRDSVVGESRELPSLARMGNVRVIRGGSL